MHKPYLIQTWGSASAPRQLIKSITGLGSGYRPVEIGPLTLKGVLGWARFNWVTFKGGTLEASDTGRFSVTRTDGKPLTPSEVRQFELEAGNRKPTENVTWTTFKEKQPEDGELIWVRTDRGEEYGAILVGNRLRAAMSPWSESNIVAWRPMEEEMLSEEALREYGFI